MAQIRTYTGDSATLQASVFTADEGRPESPNTVSWDFLAPDGTSLTASALPLIPTTGERLLLTTPTGGFQPWDVVEYNGTTWSKIAEATSVLSGNDAVILLPGALTRQHGLYRGAVRFSFADGSRKSQPITFEAIDALDPSGSTPEFKVIDMSWMLLEDCFDSELGGPWLRDKTLSYFDKDKMIALLPMAVYNINYEFTPVTDFTVESWPYDAHSPLLAQALLVESIHHLMRSYTEQPQPVGSQITYLDRRDYLQRWQIILQVEEEKLFRWLDIFKQGFFGFGTTAMLVGGYASTMTKLPRAWRIREPRFYGGFRR